MVASSFRIASSWNGFIFMAGPFFRVWCASVAHRCATIAPCPRDARVRGHVNPAGSSNPGAYAPIRSVYPDFGYMGARDTVAGMNIETNISIGRCLAQLRDQSHLKQVEVAERLGKPQSFVSKVENGERSLHACELVDYSEALGIPRASSCRQWRAPSEARRRSRRKAPRQRARPSPPQHRSARPPRRRRSHRASPDSSGRLLLAGSCLILTHFDSS